MQIASSVQAVLSAAIVGNDSVALPPGQLDRKLYTDVDKALRAMGGRWDRKTRTHVFEEEDPAEAMDRALTTGAIISRQSEFGAFYTPPALAGYVIDRAQLASGMTVLEPSAGRGALAAPAHLGGCRVTCVEIDKRSAAILCSTPYEAVVEGDFLAQKPRAIFDRVVMNPPFARQADIAHVRHAFDFLKPGGRLVAITSASVRFREDRKASDFRSFALGLGASLEELPPGSFKVSGTAVATALVTIDKPAAEAA